MRPIGQVAGFEQDDAGIVFPTVLSGEHVCGRDIKGVPVFSAQDVRVADTATFADGVGQLFLCRQFARTFKISKQIGGVVRRFL